MSMTFVKVQSMAEKLMEVQQTLKSIALLIQSEAGFLESSLYQRVGNEMDFLLVGG